MGAVAPAWPVREPALERELAARPLAHRLVRPLHAGRPLPPGVYVLAYHSVVDPDACEPWERAYAKGRTHLGTFGAQLELLTTRLRPVPLTEAQETLRAGPPDEPLLVVTFDDGYANVARGAAEVCERHGISPTVFANAAFAAGRRVYYRVVLALLLAEDHAEAVAATFRHRLGDDAYTAQTVFDRSKDAYVAQRTEEAATAAWAEVHGDRPLPHVHLDLDELRGLVARGWSVGNHTLTHATLAGLDADDVAHELETNEQELAAAGLAPLPWVAFPNGLARHVGPQVGAWLERRPGYAGFHCGGGVNFEDGGSEWFRIPVADERPRQLLNVLWRNVEAAKRLRREG